MSSALLLILLAFQAAPVPFTKLSAQAEQAFQSKSPEAPALFAKALASNPKWKDGWWRLGTLQYQKDEWKECRDSFRKLSALDGNSSPAWSMLGLCEYSAQEYDAALQHLQKGQDLGSTVGIDEVAKYSLAKLYARSGDFEAALNVYALMARLYKEKAAWVTASGIAALWKPIFPEDIQAEDRELFFLAGRAFWDAAARNVPEAKKSFDTLLAKYPSAQGVHYLYGGFATLESPDEAAPAFEAELKVQPDHPGALMALAAEYLRRGEPAKGLPYGKKSVEKIPNSFASHALYGRLLAETGDLKNGLAELETAKKLGPDDPQPRIALASVYAKLGRQEDAARERKEFLRLKANEKKVVER